LHPDHKLRPKTRLAKKHGGRGGALQAAYFLAVEDAGPVHGVADFRVSPSDEVVPSYESVAHVIVHRREAPSCKLGAGPQQRDIGADDQPNPRSPRKAFLTYSEWIRHRLALGSACIVCVEQTPTFKGREERSDIGGGHGEVDAQTSADLGSDAGFRVAANEVLDNHRTRCIEPEHFASAKIQDDCPIGTCYGSEVPG
jgi:hypothetical protein